MTVRKESGAAGAVCGSVPDAEALRKISRYTRRTFRPEELYVFPVALCDNEVDRDGERFTVGALEKLSELFPGKTGISDHNPQAKNQAARIYDCRVERDAARQTACGEIYTRLVAQAYLPRTEASRDFIVELESGIKKEVSVGCAVQSVTCSICGADLKSGPCEHRRGERYGGKLCCAVLDSPTDAYEWSFVAVPAQREAGVLKHYRGSGTEDVLKVLRRTDGGISLTGTQKAALLTELDRLEDEAQSGREYRASLRKDFLRLGALAEPGLPADSLTRAAESLNTKDLKTWGAAFRRRAEQTVPLAPQLAPRRQPNGADQNDPFRI